MQKSEAEAFRRARTPSQKKQRRDTILEAARAVAMRSGVRNVTIAAIAAEVGLAKSNVLAYFESSEEIYLRLTAEEWRDWAEATHARLIQTPVGSAEIADALATGLTERPLLCELFAYFPSSLVESSLSTRVARDVGLIAGEAHAQLVALLGDALPQLDAPRAGDLLTVTAWLGGSTWRNANPYPAIKKLAEEHDIAGAGLDFTSSMRMLIRTLIDGLAVSPETSRLLPKR